MTTDTNRASAEAMPESARPLSSAAFDLVCDMETPLNTTIDILGGLALIAQALHDSEHRDIIQRLAWLAKDQCEILEDSRGKLFCMALPNECQIGGAA